jgi:hypothetical protein
MAEEQYAVIIVYSTSHALRLEKLLQEFDVPCKLIPVPRQISSDCGVCARISLSDIEVARQAMASIAMDIQGIHVLPVKTT